MRLCENEDWVIIIMVIIIAMDAYMRPLRNGEVDKMRQYYRKRLK